MKHIFILSFIVISISALCQNNYKDYYYNRYKAENQIFNNNFDSALYFYEQAFNTVDYVLVRELYNVSVIAASKQDSSLFVCTMCKAISQGLELNTGIAKKSKYIRNYNNKLGFILNSKYDSCRLVYINTFDFELKKEILLMDELDNKSYSKKNNYKEITRIDSINQIRLKLIIEQKGGVPGEVIIGYCGKGYYFGNPSDIIIHHSFNDGISDSLLRESVYAGKYSPFQFAMRYDYHNTNYALEITDEDRLKTKAYYIFSVKALKSVNKEIINAVNLWRKDVLLPTVEHSFMRQEFNNRKYKFIFD